MESTLLNGRYTVAEAEKLLTQLFKVKTDFHLAKIDTLSVAEEDIKHSEKRIKELQEELRKILNLVKSGDFQHIALNASIVLEYCPDYHNTPMSVVM